MCIGLDNYKGKESLSRVVVEQDLSMSIILWIIRKLRDIIENPDAVYGFSPNPESTRIGKYADKIDWTNPEQVAVARQTREAYHNVNESLLQDLYNSGYTTKDIAAKFGMSLEQALEKYGSHEEIINATVRSNPGMDACTGLYDIYHGGK